VALQKNICKKSIVQRSGLAKYKRRQRELAHDRNHKQHDTMKTEYNHGGVISNIWSSNGGRSWNWANCAGEGCGELTFEAAIMAAEGALNA
jgi:hypothetical protein